jgi:Na+-driven multidrug efflux pump
VEKREIGQEFRPMLRLAAPLALTELGWLAMAFTDTVMVGRLPLARSAWAARFSTRLESLAAA